MDGGTQRHGMALGGDGHGKETIYFYRGAQRIELSFTYCPFVLANSSERTTTSSNTLEWYQHETFRKQNHLFFFSMNFLSHVLLTLRSPVQPQCLD